MDIKSVREVANKFKASLFKKSNSFAIGMLKSHFRGTGLKFKEHRVYEPGDDVRFIDWKLLAKTQTPYVKTFEEDRNVEIVVIIDAGPSMFLGVDGVSKIQAAVEICCFLYLLAKDSGDVVHTLVLRDSVINVPKCKGEEGITALVGVLEKHGIILENGQYNLNFEENDCQFSDEIYKQISAHVYRKKEVVVLSDFQQFNNFAYIKKMAYSAHVHLFQLLAPLDENNKVKFPLFSRLSGEKSGKYHYVNRDLGEGPETFFKKHFKKLRIEESYLDDFIKEML